MIKLFLLVPEADEEWSIYLPTAVPIWLEYVQFAIGGMGSDDGRQRVTDVFERAVTAAGLHVTQGANIWEAYREYENAVLAGLMVKKEKKPSKSQFCKMLSIFLISLFLPSVCICVCVFTFAYALVATCKRKFITWSCFNFYVSLKGTYQIVSR